MAAALYLMKGYFKVVTSCPMYLLLCDQLMQIFIQVYKDYHLILNNCLYYRVTIYLAYKYE